MDDTQEKNHGHTGPAGQGPVSGADPMIQARDESVSPAEPKGPTQIVPSPRRVADGALLPPLLTGAGAAPQAVPSAYDIVGSMLRFKRTALVVFILAAAPLTAAIWTQVVPKYEARAEVRVRPIIPYLVFRTEDNGMIPLYDSFVNTQVSIMRSLTVLHRVLERPEVRQTQWYAKPPKSLLQRLKGDTPSTMERLKDDLSVRPRSRTEIIDVSFTAASAPNAQLIVNVILEEYVKYTAEMSDATEDKLYRQLADQYKSLENEIQGREQVCAELSRTLGTDVPQELVSAKRIRLDETQANLTELRQKIALLELQVGQADPNGGPAGPNDLIGKQPRYSQDAEWRKLDIDMRTMRHNITNSLLTPKHSDMARMTKELEFAEELLRLREAQLDEQWRDRLKNAAGVPMAAFGAGGLGYEEGQIPVEYQLAQAKQQEQLLIAEYEKQKAEFDGLFENAQLLDKENTDLQHKQELFDAVRQRVDQKNMERNVPGSIAVLTEASVPSRPDNDRRLVFTCMAMALGLGMGGGAAFLRASASKAIYAPRDMPYPMQVPFLGCIPDVRRARASNDEPGPDLTESIRVVRTTLLSRLDRQRSTAVLVTSATEGTGKSTFTLMLGKSLAQVGKKVILVDADFRKMALTRHFKNLSGKSGFIQSLRRGSVYERHIFQTQTPGLSIVPAGRKGDSETALDEIANGAFNACLNKLRKHWDIILLDGSPIVPLADAAILCGQVDGAILVERQIVSNRVEINKALERLGSAGGRLLGTVFIGSGSGDKYRCAHSNH